MKQYLERTAAAARRAARGAAKLVGRGARLALQLAPDSLALAGAGTVSFGVSLIHFPAGVIVGGVFMLMLGILGAMRASGPADKADAE